MIELPRRKFLTILTGVIAAPAVIKADSLMKVRSIAQPEYLLKSATEHWAYGYEDTVLVTSTERYTMGNSWYTNLHLIRDLLKPGLEEAFKDYRGPVDEANFTRVFALPSSNKGWLS